MLKCPVLVSLFIVLAMGTVLVFGAQGAPVFNTLAARSTVQDSTEGEHVYFTSLVSPPVAREHRDTSPPPANVTPATAPKQLRFIKVNYHNFACKKCDLTTPKLFPLQTSQCSLHMEGGKRRAVMCGLRRLDLPNAKSGVQKWNPSLCRPFHCKCAATKEVHRTKRTIADNRTTLESHRYRVFECV